VSCEVRPYLPEDRESFRAHFVRSMDESGNSEPPFNPFEPGAEDLPRDFNFEGLVLPFSANGWLRLWVAVHERDGVVGHLDLKGAKLAVGLHRCLLGIAIERPHRGGGLGRRLMQAAIDFARGEPALEWIDLSVFSHNTGARALYQDLGFTELGEIEDKFRISGESITDVLMALDLR
jgi:RimJ/RimL family protein N-acetyltransferase